MDDDELLVGRNDGILSITLNRPDVANAITPDQRDRIVELLQEASALVDVRVVVLSATGRFFCTGADLRASRPGAPKPPDAPERVVGDVARMLREGAQKLVGAVLDCEKPVIAAVNGTAAGLGAHLALACDLVVMADTAKLVEIFVRRGLVPDGGGAWLLPRLVGLHKAKELMFFGDDVPAAEAQALGLANKVVPADTLDAAVAEWAKRLATGPTRSIGLTKRLLNRSLDSDRTTAFHDEAVAQEMNMRSDDANEGVQAFVERRDPTYRGW
ncbi:MAG TPA: enoyl-CoA hydratase-related protein [Acidimicrobiales bacterium]|nr:enoyl-CoA hydratase-related protein [Acidimicrobiales bacterium]